MTCIQLVESGRAVLPSPVAPGLLVVDKPSGMTSHDVVAKVRKIIGTRKVGHAGTLDPMATGVLLLGVERATKLLGHLALDTKAYLACIRLGAATSTDDAEGDVLSRADGSEVHDDAIAVGIAALTGEIKQVPSAVSAVKVDGRRAYERVRAGETVELPARPITVSRFDVLAVRRDPETGVTDIDAMVECSSGTYVRALARDLGRRVGVGGHLTALRRTRVGAFTLRSARTLELLAEEPTLSYDLDDSVRTAFPSRDVDELEADALSHGRRIPAVGMRGTTGIFGPSGQAIGLVTEQGKTAKPLLILNPVD